MMNACLGVVSANVELPAGYRHVQIDEALGLVAIHTGSRADHAAGARRLARKLDTFLPLGPGAGTIDCMRRAVLGDVSLWRDALAHVSGCVEIVVTATWAAEPTGHVEPQTWLRHRASRTRIERQRQDQAQRAVTDAAEGASLHLRDLRVAPFPGGLDIALLVPSEQADAALGLAPTLPKADLQISGPWPCFSFGPLQEPQRTPA